MYFHLYCDVRTHLDHQLNRILFPFRSITPSRHSNSSSNDSVIACCFINAYAYCVYSLSICFITYLKEETTFSILPWLIFPFRRLLLSFAHTHTQAHMYEHTFAHYCKSGCEMRSATHTSVHYTMYTCQLFMHTKSNQDLHITFLVLFLLVRSREIGVCNVFSAFFHDILISHSTHNRWLFQHFIAFAYIFIELRIWSIFS